jgi:hypothetical protein
MSAGDAAGVYSVGIHFEYFMQLWLRIFVVILSHPKLPPSNSFPLHHPVISTEAKKHKSL